MYFKFFNPQELSDAINEIVIGQKQASEIVSIYIFKHIYSLYASKFNINLENKPLLLLLGDTGIGKTYIIKTAAKLMDFNFIELNAKSITQEGWAGKSFADMLEESVAELSSYDERTIVFIDEFDKMCIPNFSSKSDNVADHIQNGMLKYLEGFKISGKRQDIDTSKFCFILAGNFKSIREKRKEKLRNNIGFIENLDQEELDKFLHKELEDFGVIPELIGRISEFVELNDLAEDSYKALWENPEFILNKWIKIFKLVDLELNITDEDKKNAIEKTIKNKVGVRGLIQEVQKLINREFLNEAGKINMNQIIFKYELQKMEEFQEQMSKQNDLSLYRFNPYQDNNDGE